jgi:hypothetical protein
MAASPAGYSVVARTSNSRTWEQSTSTYRASPSSRAVANKRRYVELATGLNHGGQNGTWEPSTETISLLPGAVGGAATNAPHNVFFPPDIYNGWIETLGPDGVQLKSRPLGISFFDGTNSTMLAFLTNSVGQILPSGNQVIYTNAFTDVSADLLCTFRKSGFECDLIFRSRPPSPSEFGMDPEITRLQLLTEFVDTPEPVQKALVQSRMDGLTDVTLDFGRLKIGRGKAFQIGNNVDQTVPPGAVEGTPVFKSWQHLEGRTFLVEEVTYRRIAPQFNALALKDGAFHKAFASRTSANRASPRRLLPPYRTAQVSNAKMLISSADIKERQGFVLDYVLLNTDKGDYTFQSDTTYLISGSVSLDGVATFEGGTVLKYETNATIYFWGDILSATGPYRPAIFTSRNDNSVGETLWATNTATNYYMAIANGNITTPMRYFNIRYALYGVQGYRVNMSDCQFINCSNACLSDLYTCNVTNVLICNAQNAFSGTEFTATACQVTVDGCTNLTHDWNGATDSTLSMVNSLIVNVGSIGDAALATNCVAQPAPGTQVFQTIGAGSHYLADGSPYRNAGTTNLEPGLLAELAQKTTYPPIVYSNVTIFGAATFSPQAQRDNDQPDLGYHYDPLDWCFGGVTASNASVTTMPGTAIALFGWSGGVNCGLLVTANSQFASQGTATSPVHIADFSTVQELPPSLWTHPSFSLAGNPGTSVNCRFTDFSTVAVYGQQFQISFSGAAQNFQDCEFHGGSLLDYFTSLNLTNCLLDRVYTDLEPQDANIPGIVNNLFRGGTFAFAPTVTNAFVKNNLFDGASIPDYITGLANSYDGGYNAYLTNCDQLQPAYTNDIVLVSPLTYQTGPLGIWYQPTNSPLINKGSTTADQLGLYHYTVTTNEVRETNSVVDIGFHAVATDSNGNPIDTNGDGIPDYLSDLNGNGLVDSGEIGWNIAGDLGLKVLITKPRNGSVIP